jgi:hypothetical protein
VQRDLKWIRVERLLLNIYLPLTFFVASVVIFKGFVNLLGYMMTAAIVICLLVRLRAWWMARHPANALEPQHG